MPKRRRAWSSWNSISNGNQTCVTYWLNRLQNLEVKKNYFLTLNPIYEISETKTLKKVMFTHPYLNSANIKIQNELHTLQGVKRIWFCGSYFGYGFHEDGLKSSIELVKNFRN